MWLIWSGHSLRLWRLGFDQWFSSWENFVPRGHYALSFLVFLMGDVVLLVSCARNATKHPTTHKIAPTTKNYLIKMLILMRLRNLD